MIYAYPCLDQVPRKDVKSKILQTAHELFSSQRRRFAPENAPGNFGFLDRDLYSIIGDPPRGCFKCGELCHYSS
ncbi:hypothetical protein BMW22_05345 [Rhizobium leguminosarum]|uniref:Uncharacterized protein n=1 Tax=Rhizobium leguminosarum TaxID=384 RepID=A0A1L3ZG50_RHILE|nr:hypothetical protein BMW22_05345 [Rhizobium leguminosarum]